MSWLELFERFQGAVAAGIAALIGFSGELITIRDILDENLTKLNEMGDIFLHPLYKENTFLDACVGKLGLLHKKL